MPPILPTGTDSASNGFAPGSVRRVLSVLPEVADALASGAPVVALESTIISHGLPRPDNLRVAREIEQAVRRGRRRPGDHRPGRRPGLHRAGRRTRCEQVADRDDVVKVSTRDLATVAARGGMGATTVAATSHLAARAGIRSSPPAASAACTATPAAPGTSPPTCRRWRPPTSPIVCAGVKSILDVAGHPRAARDPGRHRPRLRHHAFPGFYLSDSGHPLDWRVDSPEEVAAVMAARTGPRHRRPRRRRRQPAAGGRAGRPGAARPAAARRARGRRGRAASRGKDVTPFLLEFFHRESKGVTPRGEHPHHPAQRRAGRADRRRRGRGRA